MFKFLHAADIHLDSPLRGLERYEGAPAERIRQATRRALANLVQLALDERVAFVLIAGDLYDGDWKDYNTGLFFVAQMARLREANIPVFLIAGNHDAQNRMTRSLRLPEHVALFAAEQPETRVLDHLNVAIHGQSFARPAVTDDLSQSYPVPERGFFNIGLLHTCATGRDGHERYAPCTIDGLRRLRYDYWALGHIHQRETLNDYPYIAFPGNVQGRHVRETGPKGCLLVTVTHSRQAEVEFRCLDTFRWEICTVDTADAPQGDAVLERTEEALRFLLRASDDRPLAVRVEMRGRCPAHAQLLADTRRWSNQVRAQAVEIGGEALWIEKVQFHTEPPGDDSSFPLDGPLGELLQVLGDLRGDTGRLQELRQEFRDLERQLPDEVRNGNELNWDDPAWLRGTLEQAQQMLIQRLRAGRDAT